MMKLLQLGKTNKDCLKQKWMTNAVTRLQTTLANLESRRRSKKKLSLKTKEITLNKVHNLI